MTDIERQRVKFTGKRTGMDGIFILGYGIVQKGQTIEVDASVAERWTTPGAMNDGTEASDWTKVGEEIKRNPDEAAESDQRQRERLIVAVSAPKQPTESPKDSEDDKPAKTGKDGGE